MGIFLLVLAIIIMVIIMLIIQYYLASQFYEVAKLKGYNDAKYLWIPFLFGIVGWILVAALPSAYLKNIRATTPQATNNTNSQNSFNNNAKPIFKSNNDSEVICCDFCGTDNPSGSKVCKKCKKKLSVTKNY